ncbi:MAG: porin family protein [Hyphomicrobiales bacterium]|nr:porin family protein [Hyphomicrobiales bacterium]MCP5000961.1 porin family protein [Hyphomicrobiales bacterium]
MIKNVMSHTLIAALLLGGSGAALSADLDNIIYAPQLPRTQPVEVGNGWYLRGDVGYNFSTDGSATSFRTFDVTTLAYDTQNYATSSFDSDVTFGFGVGYQLNEWFRAEALATYQNGTFNGTSASTTLPCTGGVTDTGCNTAGSADFTAYGLMANGYVDLGTYSGFTPYVGAGAGYTLVDYENYNATEACVDGLVACATFAPFATTHVGEKTWRFTYALMAGIAHEFTRNLKADLGYKYTNVDGGDTYAFDTTSATAGATGIQGTDNGFSTHQIIASLRYALW